MNFLRLLAGSFAAVNFVIALFSSDLARVRHNELMWVLWLILLAILCKS